MSNARTFQRTVAAATVLTAFSIGAAHAAASVVFNGVLKPNGHARSKAEKFADAATCGMSPKHRILVIMPVFEKCMGAKGWAFGHYNPDPSTRPRSGTNESFVDTRGDANGHPRGDAALQADTRACGAHSKQFRQCIAARGWQFMYVQRAPQRHVPAPAPEWAQWGTSSSSSSSNLDDEARRNDESRANTQAAMDAINASNASVAAQQAADQQQQTNIINQFAPTQP